MSSILSQSFWGVYNKLASPWISMMTTIGTPISLFAHLRRRQPSQEDIRVCLLG